MTFLELGMIGIGGFMGAVIRYLISRKMNSAEHMPIGTLIVNLMGALLVGMVFGLELSRMWTLLLASGFAGALTTFSTLNKELIELWLIGKKKKMLLYIFVTYCGGIGVTLIGYLLVSK